ncbi:MAG: peptidylprolyl isomerase [Anaerolineales bacterium]
MPETKKTKTIKTKKHLAREQREAKQIRLILIFTIVVGVVVVGLILYGVINHFIIRPRTPVAQVGDTKITVEYFQKRVKYTRIQMLNTIYQYYNFYEQFGEFGTSFLQTAQSMASQLTQPVALGSDVLDQLIDEIIVREEAQKRGITASSEEIDEAIQAAFGFFPGGTPTPTMTSTIASTPTYSETQLALVTLTNTPTVTATATSTPEMTSTPTEDVNAEEGTAEPAQDSEDTSGETQDTSAATATTEPTATITPTPTITVTPTTYTTQLYGEDIREFNDLYEIYNFDYEDLRNVFEAQILRDKLLEEITKDLVPVKEEVWARHILLETEDQAQEVLDLLDQGEDFSTLAATYSTDTGTKDKGGDLGWFDYDTMVPEFSEAAFNMEVGEISEPVESEFGFHIIQVLGKRESQVEDDEFFLEKENTFTDWLSNVRNSRDDIVIFDVWEDFVPDTPEISTQFLNQLYPTPVPTDSTTGQ